MFKEQLLERISVSYRDVRANSFSCNGYRCPLDDQRVNVPNNVANNQNPSREISQDYWAGEDQWRRTIWIIDRLQTEADRTWNRSMVPYLMIFSYSLSRPLESRQRLYITEASTLAGLYVFGSFRSEITESRIVLCENQNSFSVFERLRLSWISDNTRPDGCRAACLRMAACASADCTFRTVRIINTPIYEYLTPPSSSRVCFTSSYRSR